MTITLVEQAPLFVESWESRMRAACRELNAIKAQAKLHRSNQTTRAEYEAYWAARWRVQRLVREAGE